MDQIRPETPQGHVHNFSILTSTKQETQRHRVKPFKQPELR